jgi:hypothetical protein
VNPVPVGYSEALVELLRHDPHLRLCRHGNDLVRLGRERFRHSLDGRICRRFFHARHIAADVLKRAAGQKRQKEAQLLDGVERAASLRVKLEVGPNQVHNLEHILLGEPKWCSVLRTALRGNVNFS